MTRWGVLADIHGNRAALERALATFEREGVERLAVLGDTLGRGDPDGCVRLIRDRAAVSVVGNRDLDWRTRVSEAASAYVTSLPATATMDGVLFAHGDSRLTRPLSSQDIAGNFRRARVEMAAAGCQFWLFGHTHRARVWRLPAGNEAHLLFDAAVSPLPAMVHLRGDDPAGPPEADPLWIVNAGSVGLPFAGKGPASALILDTASLTVEIFGVGA
ncbi:MAG: metallophosphoesterase [Chloroflexota bacterium]